MTSSGCTDEPNGKFTYKRQKKRGHVKVEREIGVIQ